MKAAEHHAKVSRQNFCYGFNNLTCSSVSPHAPDDEAWHAISLAPRSRPARLNKPPRGPAAAACHNSRQQWKFPDGPNRPHEIAGRGSALMTTKAWAIGPSSVMVTSILAS